MIRGCYTGVTNAHMYLIRWSWPEPYTENSLQGDVLHIATFRAGWLAKQYEQYFKIIF